MEDGGRKVELAADDAAYVDAKVASGEFDSAQAVVSAGLSALRDQQGALDRWIIDEIVSVADAMDADPSLGVPAVQVFEELRARHRARFDIDR